jgi:hypothetical protein
MVTQTNGPASELGSRLDETLIATRPSSLEDLEEIVTAVGRSPWLWGHAVSFDIERRSHRVLYKTPHLEVALFGWAAGQDTVFHDHGGASGATYTSSGSSCRTGCRLALRLRSSEERPWRSGGESPGSCRPDPGRSPACRPRCRSSR